MERLDKCLEVKRIAQKCVEYRPLNNYYTTLLKEIIKILKGIETEKIFLHKSRCEELKAYFDELREILAFKKPSLEIDLDLCRYADKLLDLSEKDPVLKKEVLKRLYRYSNGLLPVYDDNRLERTNNLHEFINNRIKTKRRRISGKIRGRLQLEFHGAYDAIRLNFRAQEANFPKFLELLRNYCLNLPKEYFFELYRKFMRLREPHRKLLRLRRENFNDIKKRIESILIPHIELINKGKKVQIMNLS